MLMRHKNGSTWWLPERDHGPLQPGSYTSVWQGSSVTVETVKGGLVHFIGWSHRRECIPRLHPAHQAVPQVVPKEQSMTADQIVKYLAEIPDDAMNHRQMVEMLVELIGQARSVTPKPEILLRHIYLDNHWPEHVAIVPLRIHGDMVTCWVGAPVLVDSLTLRDLETCPTVTKTIRFFLDAAHLRPGLDDIPF
jgi:hypothetical protein